ncbi:MAG TPA: hypothetical protein V6D47_17140 [Oscillatoriaceae cyanobacterium]
MFETRVTIAEQTVALELPGEAWLPALLPRFGAYLTERPADARLALTLAHDMTTAPFGEAWVESRPEGLCLQGENFRGLLPEAGAARVTVFQAHDGPEDQTYLMAVDSMLRMVLARLLAAHGAVLFHSAGIATSAGGYVFFGPSGSGKTTVCRLSSTRYRVLCDEIIAVVPVAGAYRLYGTPFAGAWGDSIADSAPLNELFYLKKAPETRRVPLSRRMAVAALLESVVTYDRTPGHLDRLMDALLALSAQVPVSQLEFEPKESLWETVLSPTPSR